jgi:hypothetical protein
MGRHTTLKLITGQKLCEWFDATGTYSVFDDARREIADWANCSLLDVEEIETEGGEFLAVEGEPVAYLECRFFPATPTARVIDLPAAQVVDLRPMLAAE